MVQANFDGNLNPKLVCNIPSNHMMVKTKKKPSLILSQYLYENISIYQESQLTIPSRFKRGWFRVMHFIFPELTAASNLNVDPLENSTKVGASTYYIVRNAFIIQLQYSVYVTTVQNYLG